jgi:RHS repeat-associated protein
VQHDQQTIADYGYGDAPSSPLYRYVYASYIDEPVVRKAAGTSGTIHYYHRNQQYSITAMTTSTGAVAERYAYTAYGQPTILDASGSVLTSSAVGNRYTYTGREWDETLGIHHFRARWMSPLAGRFLGRDPIGYEGSEWGLYEYCGSRPKVMVDPHGLSWSWLDFWNHYRNGHGRPVTLSEIGLLDLYRQAHKSKVFSILSDAISFGEVFVNCEDGPGGYSRSISGPSGRQNWNSTNVIGLYPLGNSSVFFTTTVEISWNCEYCCANGGQLKPTSIHLNATASFRLVDAFTDIIPGNHSPAEPAIEQGKCVYECWNKFIANRKWQWDKYRSCRNECQRKFPTNDPWGIPYGITSEWQEDMNLSYRGACDQPLAEIRDPRWG